jgi:hypothetical protein
MLTTLTNQLLDVSFGCHANFGHGKTFAGGCDVEKQLQPDFTSTYCLRLYAFLVYLSERKNKLGKAHKYYVPCGLPTYTYI